MSPALQIRALRKNFGSAAIIRGLTLDIERGERHTVIGPNGAGKTTLFNLLTGFYRPDAGEIRLNGRDVTHLPQHAVSRRGLSRSFQITNIFPRMSVFENVRIAVMARHGRRFSLFSQAATAHAVNAEASELIEKVRLAPRANHFAGDLAYSEQRALEIAMALGPGADVILLDEPTAGMSRDEAMHLVDLIGQITAGKTLVMIEHDMDVVFSLSDRISVLVYGEIIATGTPDAIRNDARVQQAYLGEARA